MLADTVNVMVSLGYCQWKAKFIAITKTRGSATSIRTIYNIFDIFLLT